MLLSFCGACADEYQHHSLVQFVFHGGRKNKHFIGQIAKKGKSYFLK